MATKIIISEDAGTITVEYFEKSKKGIDWIKADEHLNPNILRRFLHKAIRNHMRRGIRQGEN